MFSSVNSLISPEYLDDVNALILDFGLAPAELLTNSIYDQLRRNIASDLMSLREDPSKDSAFVEEYIRKTTEHFRRTRHHYENDDFASRELLLPF